MTNKVSKKILRIERNFFVNLRKCFWPITRRRRRRRFFWTGGAPPPPTEIDRRAAADTMTSAHSSIAYITLVHTLPLSTAHYDFTAAQFVINCTQNYALVIPSSVTCNSANVTFIRCIYNAAGSSPAAENGSLPVTVSSDERDPILSSVEADVGLTGSVEAYQNKAFRQQKGDEGEVKVLIDDGPSTGRHQGASLIGCETASNLDQEVSFERAYQ